MPKENPIRVALVDDQLLVRSGFRMLINSQADLEVVAEASNGRLTVSRVLDLMAKSTVLTAHNLVELGLAESVLF